MNSPQSDTTIEYHEHTTTSPLPPWSTSNSPLSAATARAICRHIMHGGASRTDQMKVERGWLVEGPPMASSGTVMSLPETYNRIRTKYANARGDNDAQAPNQNRQLW